MSDHQASGTPSRPTPRRVPQQTRSRGRVERILEAADRLVVSGGVESVNTRVVAAAADMPVATLYQYFADKEAILLALVERDLAELDARIRRDVERVDPLSVRTLVEVTMRAFVDLYRRRRSLVMIFLRGRTVPAIRDHCRAHNRRLAHELYTLARARGLVLPGATGLHAELAMEITDRLLQVAFEKDPRGDPRVVDEAIAVVSGYLETHSAARGVFGPGPSPGSTGR
jgi:AcrR family transcriptional regulator